MRHMRRAGEGTYYREGSRYCWAVRVGTRRIVRKAPTHAALKKKVLIVQRLLAEGKAMRSKSPRVDAFLASYLESLDVRPSTMRSYKRSAKLLTETIGSVRLDKLSAIDVEVAGKRISEKHGSRDAQLAHSFLRSALRLAERDGIIPSNPARVARTPKHVPKPKRYLQAAEAGDLLKALPPNHYGLLVKFILYTGTRVSEALNVTPFDVTAEGVRIRVSKTRAGEYRLVPLHPEARAVIQQMHELRQGYAAARPWLDSGRLFCSSVGTPLIARNVTRALDVAIIAAGVPRVSLHDLRRTFATLLARTSIGRRSMASVMGWSKMESVEEIYVMADEAAKAAAVEEIEFK